jgi:hypothetical protein
MFAEEQAGHIVLRDIPIFDVYVPAIIVIFLAGAVITWGVDLALEWTGLYRHVWHPDLFRASILVSICGLLGLLVCQ